MAWPLSELVGTTMEELAARTLTGRVGARCPHRTSEWRARKQRARAPGRPHHLLRAAGAAWPQIGKLTQKSRTDRSVRPILLTYFLSEPLPLVEPVPDCDPEPLLPFFLPFLVLRSALPE